MKMLIYCRNARALLRNFSNSACRAALCCLVRDNCHHKPRLVQTSKMTISASDMKYVLMRRVGKKLDYGLIDCKFGGLFGCTPRLLLCRLGSRTTFAS